VTLRQRVERLEGPRTPPVDEAAVDAEIRQLVAVVGEDAFLRVLAEVEADFARRGEQ